MSTVVLILGGVALLLVLAIAKKLVVDEVSGWLMPLSAQLVRKAAAQLPRQSDRYEEEWLAELEALRDRKLSGLLFAVRVLRGAKSTGSALEELVAEAELSRVQELIAARPLVKPDMEAIAKVIRDLVERSDRRHWTWAELLRHMRSAGAAVDVSDQVERITDAFSRRIDLARETCRTRSGARPGARPE